ncbi:TonB-dependent receptor [Frateuria defendens]|uniref:TonB-dependent receptor n=1 Tax=Frateuria defendens TaxID=2219559 RepID=UPI00066FE463|nr:TonB-dependent receptor [Frateuria defendens]
MLAASLLMALASGVQAQSITGGLYGRAPTGGDVVIRVTGLDSGFVRDLRPDRDGRYSTAGLNPGQYAVSVVQGGRTIVERTAVVTANVQTPVDVVATAAPGARELGAVRVSANAASTVINPIDVSTPELASRYSMDLVNQLPIGRSMENIALLKSNVRYDSQTTGLVQMGGATSAENRYFYNEFDTTNDRTSMGAQRLPAEAIGETQVLTNSFGASWTNATGGIMAATVRQGGNDFKAGYSLYYTPPTSRLLQPRGHNTLDSAGNYYNYISANSSAASTTQYLWASGALVKDKLFFFALLGNQPPSSATRNTSQYHNESSKRDKNGLLNLTWNLTNNQSINVVGYKDWSSNFTNQYRLNTRYDPSSVGRYYGWSSGPVDTKFLIGNYHWQATDDLGFRLMAGYLGETDYNLSSSDNAKGLPYVESVDPVTQQTYNIGLINSSTTRQPDRYWRRGFKGDMNWQLGDHRIVAGAEHYKHFLSQQWGSPDAGYWTYYQRPNAALSNGATAPADGRYVTQYYDKEGGQFYSVNKAAYLEDYWQTSDRVLLYGGLRYDRYINKDAIGRDFLRLPMLSPRLGLAWDVRGDSSLKIGANLGKYSLSMPSNFSFGVAEARTEWTRYYTYTGMDPTTHAPTGLNQIGDVYQTQYGVPPSAEQIATTNIKAPYQYEAQVYVQMQLTPTWAAQADLSYAKLERIVDDTCYGDAIDAWARSHGYPDYDLDGEKRFTCIEFNPGEPLNVRRDYDGDGKSETLSIPASFYGVPKGQHKYYRLTLDLSHSRSAEEPYYLDISYTWAHEYGNTDGYLDLTRRTAGYIGQTSQFDFPGVMQGATGDLSNDVRHSLTLSGVYYFSTGLRLGSVLSMHTGEPLSCLGTYPNPDDPAYGYATHYCDGKLSTEGSAGRLPFFWALNASIGYDWTFGEHNKLSLDLQMQNVTNRQGITNRNQNYDQGYLTDDGNLPPRSNSYGAPSWQAPRTTSLALRYTFD